MKKIFTESELKKRIRKVLNEVAKDGNYNFLSYNLFKSYVKEAERYLKKLGISIHELKHNEDYSEAIDKVCANLHGEEKNKALFGLCLPNIRGAEKRAKPKSQEDADELFNSLCAEVLANIPKFERNSSDGRQQSLTTFIKPYLNRAISDFYHERKNIKLSGRMFRLERLVNQFVDDYIVKHDGSEPSVKEIVDYIQSDKNRKYKNDIEGQGINLANNVKQILNNRLQVNSLDEFGVGDDDYENRREAFNGEINSKLDKPSWETRSDFEQSEINDEVMNIFKLAGLSEEEVELVSEWFGLLGKDAASDEMSMTEFCDEKNIPIKKLTVALKKLSNKELGGAGRKLADLISESRARRVIKKMILEILSR